MDAQESLISMGFSPDRVDWAIRETRQDADLQARLEHLMQHEGEEVPTTKSLNTTNKKSDKYEYNPPAYSPPTIPPPDRQSQASGSTLPRPAESRSDLQVHQRRPDPLSLSIENESVGRYAGFLATERGKILAAHSDPATAEVVLGSISQFFDEELKRWQKVLQPSKTSSASENPPRASNNISTPTNEGQAHVATEINAAVTPENIEANKKTTVYDAIATYDSTRPLLPPLESVKQSLNGIVTKYTERESVEKARKRAWEVCTQMEKEVSDLHWQTTVTNSSAPNDPSPPNSVDVLAQILAMQSRGDYQGAGRFAQDHSRREAALQQQQIKTAADQYRRCYLDPATAAVNKAISQSRPLYAEIQKYIGEEDKQMDVVKTIGALEQVASNIECGMQLLEKLDDEKNIQELERRIQDATNRQQFLEVTKLHAQKGSRDYEVNAIRTSQKVARRAPFFDIAISRVNKTMADVDKNQATLKENLKELLATIPTTMSLEQEEARAQAGDASPSKVPLPSKELFNQISDANSALMFVNASALEMQTLLKDLKRQQLEERVESDLAQFTLRETRAGRWTSLYEGPGRQLQERAGNELAGIESAFDRFQQANLMEISAISGPVNTFLATYQAREALVMQRLGMGMSFFSGGGVGVTNPELDSLQQLFQQQSLLQQQHLRQYLMHPGIWDNET